MLCWQIHGNPKDDGDEKRDKRLAALPACIPPVLCRCRRKRKRQDTRLVIRIYRSVVVSLRKDVQSPE